MTTYTKKPADPFLESKMELLNSQGGALPPAGTDKFGTDPSGTAGAGYGEHALSGSTWNLWSPSNDPGAVPSATSPMTIHVLDSTWAWLST
jgi:hypothetical protein